LIFLLYDSFVNRLLWGTGTESIFFSFGTICGHSSTCSVALQNFLDVFPVGTSVSK
jgi:hypothetical protein